MNPNQKNTPMFAHGNIEYNHNISESKLFSDVAIGNEMVAYDWLL